MAQRDDTTYMPVSEQAIKGNERNIGGFERKKEIFYYFTGHGFAIFFFIRPLLTLGRIERALICNNTGSNSLLLAMTYSNIVP